MVLTKESLEFEIKPEIRRVDDEIHHGKRFGWDSQLGKITVLTIVKRRSTLPDSFNEFHCYSGRYDSFDVGISRLPTKPAELSS